MTSSAISSRSCTSEDSRYTFAVMRTAAACVLVLVGCAKHASKQEAATAPPPDRQAVAPVVTGAAPSPGEPPQLPPAEPTPINGASPTRGGDKAAKEAARSQGLLGPTDKDSFRPLDGPEGGGAAPTRSKDRDSKVTVPSVGGAPTGVSLGVPAMASNDHGTAVRAAVANNQAALDKCYATARTTKATLAGTLSLKFTVKADGKLDAVTVHTSTVKDAALERCIVGIVQATKLGQPLGSTALSGTMPFTFTPPTAK